jgi:hypothetical protein
MSVARRSMAVKGRNPSRTTKAAPRPSRPSTSTLTPRSISSRWSVVWSTSASETPATVKPSSFTFATAIIRHSVLPSLELTVYGPSVISSLVTGIGGRPRSADELNSGISTPLPSHR